MLARCLLSGANAKEVKIFYSYSRDNAEFRSMVDALLGRFRWDVAVRTWYDGAIPAGTEWEKEIFRNLDAADIVLLFVTKSFVQSDYCMSVEVPRALARHERGGSRVIPIIVQETEPSWRKLPFAKLQVLPQNGRPIEEWADPSKAVESVIRGIVNIIASGEIDPTSRCNWRLQLDGSMADFSLDDESAVVDELRRLSRDATLRLLTVCEGSIVMYMDSTREGFVNLQSCLFESQPTRVDRYTVIRIVELYGAGVQASAATVNLFSGVRPVEPPGPETLLFPSPADVPVMLKGIRTSKDEPMTISYIFDPGEANLHGAALTEETQKHSNYFLTALAVPYDDLWVNLAPDESMKMLGNTLHGTHMGRVLLDQDYQLKRLSASLLHPDSECGKVFWNQLFERAQEEFGTTELPYNTFQRVWITPKKAVVYEGRLPKDDKSDDNLPLPAGAERQAFVVEKCLELLCEDEYLEAYGVGDKKRNVKLDDLCSSIFKEVVLPVIDKEVNEGKTFAPTRQIFNSLVLAAWFIQNYHSHPQWQKYIHSGNPKQLLGQIRSVSPVDQFVRMISNDEKEPASSTRSHKPLATEALEPETDNIEEDFLRGIKLWKNGDLETSEQILRNVVNARVRLHGEEARPTLVASSHLGQILYSAGKLEESRILHQRVLDTRRRVLGEEHDLTRNSMTWLAETLLAMGRNVEACRLRAEAAEAKVRASDAYRIEENKEYFDKYLNIFRNGVFYLVRDEYDRYCSQRITRTYFSGAIDFRKIQVTVIHHWQ